MSLFVVGMHRSGTSALARLLNMAGCYIGSDDEIMPAKPDNPAGFWERVDVVALNEEILAATGHDWHTTLESDVESLEPGERKRFEKHAAEIAGSLAAHEPWVVKDPRLCLTFPLWRASVTRPIVLLVNRRPLEVAKSLQSRNGFPLVLGVALWELHTLAMLRLTAGVARTLVSHHDLMTRPHEVTKRLVGWLESLGVSGLTMPAPEAISAFVNPDFYRARADADAESPYLNPTRRQLLAALEDGSALSSGGTQAPSPDAVDVLTAHRGEVELEQRLEQALAARNQLFTEKQAKLAQTVELGRERDELFAQKNQLLAEARSAATERAHLFAQKNRYLAERQDLFEQKNRYLAERQVLFDQKNELLAQLDAAAAEQTVLFDQKNELLAQLDAAAAEQTVLFDQKSELLAQLDVAVAEQKVLFDQKSELLAQLDAAVAEQKVLFDQKNQLLADLDTAAAERQELFEQKNRLLEEHHVVVSDRDALFVEKQRLLEELAVVVGERDALFVEKNRRLAECAELKAQLETLRSEHEAVLAGLPFRIGSSVMWLPRRLQRLRRPG